MSLTYDFTRNDDGVIYCLYMADIYIVLSEHGKGGRDLTDKQLQKVIQRVENGMGGCWHDVLDWAVAEVLQEKPSDD